ncbi:MAG: lipopolysaccharide heptosyltransferase I [Pseudomonadales bacterium]
MKVLIVKMSSLGDVVHTLPAVTDAARIRPEISFDWVVEEGFASVAELHPAVDKVIEIAIRRWRKHPFKSMHEFAEFRKQLRSTDYDLILDAQGLIKSASVVLMARGKSGGYAFGSARESLASLAYQFRIETPVNVHAIEKIRYLFAQLLDYDVPTAAADYGLALKQSTTPNRQVMFLHGTTWPSKHWPLDYWRELVRLSTAAGYHVLLPHGNDEEKARAQQIASAGSGAEVMAPVRIADLIGSMRQCEGVVCVDSGLGHLAAALELPLVGIYGPTDPGLTGPVARNREILASDHLPCIPCLSGKCRFDRAEVTGAYPPCFRPVDAERVWEAFIKQVEPRVQVP